MNNLIDKQIAEDATGCVENHHGLGTFYAGPINRQGYANIPGTKLEPDEYRAYMDEGGQIAVPNAGAGSYREVFEVLGYPMVESFETGSSAGNWNFCVFDGNYWYIAFQENRYPRCGFNYSVDRSWLFDTLKQCQEFMAQGN